MSTMILPALMYTIFALCVITFGLMLRVDLYSDMYKATIQRFETLPWDLNPERTVYDVQGGPDVYTWLRDVFMAQLFSELPEAGGIQMYCMAEYPCMLGEGVVRNGRSMDCAGDMVTGDRNCPTYMAVGSGCCEACQSDSCPETEVKIEKDTLRTNATAVDVSTACADEMPSWLQDLSQWYSEDKGDWSITPAPPPPTSDVFSYCPERVPEFSTDINTRKTPTGRPVMLAQYNQVLVGRLSLKRLRLQESPSESFANAYEKVMSVGRIRANIADNWDLESTTTFGDGSPPFVYQEAKGYKNAGAFVAYLNFVGGVDKHDVVNQMQSLYDNNWFDLNQGSFVVELLMFNGNIEKFMYVAFIFEHTFAGQCDVSILVNMLELSLHDPAKADTYYRFILYLIILVFYVYFVKHEVDDMSADYAAYFGNFMAVLHLGSLTLTALCILRYLTICLDYNFINFEFPLPDGQTEVFEAFENLTVLALRMEEFVTLMSVNILFILVRLISLLTGLAPDSGIVFNTIYQVRFHLSGFFAMFVLLVFAFAFSGYYLFGNAMDSYRSFPFAFTTTMKAIMRESMFKEMNAADPSLGFSFYLCFHLFFLIAQQPLLSIIIRGYDLEKQRMNMMTEADRFPLKRFWRQIKSSLRESSTWLNRVIVFINGLFFGSGDGGSMRINYEQVAKLRDGRATRPRIRKVVYDKRGADSEPGADNVNVPQKDVTLRHQDPFYPNGMMQYYVEITQPEGAAEENKVKKGFRLIGIEMRGGSDTEKFREKKQFHAKSGQTNADGTHITGYDSETKKILEDLAKNLPVTLEFEGGVKPISRECVCLLIFIGIFWAWAYMIVRGNDSNSLASAHISNVMDPVWYEYNPSRLQNFDSVFDIPQYATWIDEYFKAGHYSCLTKVDDETSTCQLEMNTQTRDDWFLWSGVGSSILETKRSTGLPLTEEPVAANGLSIGYLPFTAPARPNVDVVQSTTVPKLKDYNIAVLPNNQIRITIQLACFEKNKNGRYKEQYPFVIHKVIQQSWGCSEEPCMQKMIEDKGSECYNFQGSARDLTSMTGQWSNVEYKFTQDGTYGRKGGIAIGTGNTAKEVLNVRKIMANDLVMDAQIVSVVLESIDYNANLDVFSYTAVSMNVHATGLLQKEIWTGTFPLTVFSRGQLGGLIARNGALTVLYGLFLCYCFFVIYFLIYLLFDMSVQYQITKELQKPAYMFPVDFFLDDWWNFVDVCSTICNVMVVYAILRFMLVDSEFQSFSAEVVKSWTVSYEIVLESNLGKADQMNAFHDAAHLYRQFIGWVALNGLFMMVRLIKYFGAVPQLRLMMTTMSSAFYELAIITSITLVVWMAFTVMFFLRFGIQFSDKYGQISRAFTELFLYVCGRFATADIQANSPIYFIFMFTTFQVIFFLLLNMYLVAIVYRWKDARRDAQEFSLQSTVENMSKFLSPNTRAKDDKKKDNKHLDIDFWRACSVITHLGHMDKFGKIQVPDSKGAPRAIDDDDGKAVAPYEDPDQDEGGLDLDKEGGAKEFLAIFKRVHMEIASQMCRKVAPKGAGVGDLGEDEQLAAAPAAGTMETQEETDAHIEIGIVEEPVDPSQAITIEKTLRKALADEEHIAKELWLDALVTALEDAGTLRRLQQFFLPMPMIKPKKPQEWGQFQQKKVKMEERLACFLKWLQEETEIRHYRFLKDSAAAKERVLKQQSLVLTDYLEHLDEQISKLSNDIKVLERRTAEMKEHVQPLM